MLSNIAFKVGLATAETGAVFGIMPWQKKNSEKSFERFIHMFDGIVQMCASIPLTERAIIAVVSNQGTIKNTIVFYSTLFNIVSVVPLVCFGLYPGCPTEAIKKYAATLQHIQQIVGLALSLVIAVNGSAAYGITSAAWITFGMINEKKDFSIKTNAFLSIVFLITATAVGIISKVPYGAVPHPHISILLAGIISTQMILVKLLSRQPQ